MPSRDTLTAITALASFISGIIAFLALGVTLLAGVRNKQTDVLMECHRRFDALMVERVRLQQRLNAGTAGPNADLLFEIAAWGQRFWSLQFDQYEWWQHGHVDWKTYCYWMLSRRRDLDLAKQGGVFETVAFIDGQQEVRNRWPSEPDNPLSAQTNFVNFMANMADMSADQVIAHVMRYGPRGLARFGL